MTKQKSEHSFSITTDYRDFIVSLKESILNARHTAMRKVNSALVLLYYDIGKQIALKQQQAQWGDNLIGQVEKDLKEAFPDMKGFSRRNLLYMKKFFLFFRQEAIVQQLVAQIPWGHIVLLTDKVKDLEEAYFYVNKTIENSWSRSVLEHQIDLKLYQRQGKLQSNFSTTIEAGDMELVTEAFKESYVLDFLQLEEQAKERDIEKALEQNISRFLLEMGRGFAYVGRQYKLTVGQQEFFVDLLFYNYLLKRFVVVELKTTAFAPEFAGQMSLYLAAVDRDVKTSEDKPTIGLIICKTKDDMVVEYTLSMSNQPTGVAEYTLAELPEDIARYLPSEEELRRVTQ